jgi:hypothetical protein
MHFKVNQQIVKQKLGNEKMETKIMLTLLHTIAYLKTVKYQHVTNYCYLELIQRSKKNSQSYWFKMVK